MWTKEQNKILIDNYKTSDANSLASMLNKSSGEVYKQVRNLELTKSPHWTEVELDILRKNISVLKKKDLLLLLPRRTWSNITAKANTLGLKRTDTPFSFEVIDTEEKAYILGFISADGYTRHKGSFHILSLCLAEHDKSHVEKLKNIISPRHKIYETGGGLNIFPSGKTYECQRQFCFAISSKKLVHEIEKHIQTNNKTYTLQFPKTVPEELIPHYIRGYFDGDGSITSGRSLNCVIVGTENMMISVSSYFNSFFSNTANAIKRGNVWYLSYGSMVAVAFLQYIYKDATIYLDRKYALAKPYLDTPLIHSVYYKPNWSEEEILILKHAFSYGDKENLLDLLPNRSWRKILVKATELGLREKGEARYGR